MAPVVRMVVGGWYVAVSTHALLVVVAVVVGTLVAVRRAREPELMAVLAPLLAVAALGGAWALHRVAHRTGAGLSSMGGISAVVAVLAVGARASGRRFGELADAFAPAALLALGIGRVGCFLAGCCFGWPTDLPWGVVLPELGPPARHPLQLYSAACDGVLALGLLRASVPPGAVAARAAVGLGVARLGLEHLRDGAAADLLGAGLRLAHVGAMLLIVGGLIALARGRRRSLRHRVALPLRGAGP